MAAGALDMSKETVRDIVVQDLGMRELVAKLVPLNLTEEQKDRRLISCMDFEELFQYDNFWTVSSLIMKHNNNNMIPKAKRQFME
jgi:hypothetical protein